MRRARFIGVAGVLLALSLLLVSSGRPLRAQTSPPPDGLSRLLWVSAQFDLVKTDASEPTTYVPVDSGTFVALAVDPARRVVWGLDPSRVTTSGMPVRGYSFDGGFLHMVRVPGFAALGLVRVQPDDGSLWVATDSTVRHFDAQGHELLAVSVGDYITLVELDLDRQRLWVGGLESLRAFDPQTGQLLQTIDLRLPKRGGQFDSFLNGGALDPATGRLWVVLTNLLRRYSPAGVRELEIALPRLPDDASEGQRQRRRWNAVDADGAGGVWLGDRDHLVHVDAAGQMLAHVQAATGSWRLSPLAADLTDQSVWTAGDDTIWVRHFSAHQPAAARGALARRPTPVPALQSRRRSGVRRGGATAGADHPRPG